MTVRVDLEALKRLSQRVRELENRIHQVERENLRLGSTVSELQNTLRGLAYHSNFEVELTPTGREVDATQPGTRKSPIRTEDDVEVMLNTAIPDEVEEEVEAELPDSKCHWTPKKQ